MDTEYAWAAGFIDGEGTITLKRYKAKTAIRGLHYQPFVSLSQANHEGHPNGVEHMKELFGGSTSMYLSKAPRLHVTQWSIVSRQAIECLKKIRPYLKVKDRHADLLLSYYETVGEKSKTYRITDEQMAKREAIWAQMRAMNQKGTLHLQRLSEVTPQGDATV